MSQQSRLPISMSDPDTVSMEPTTTLIAKNDKSLIENYLQNTSTIFYYSPTFKVHKTLKLTDLPFPSGPPHIQYVFKQGFLLTGKFLEAKKA